MYLDLRHGECKEVMRKLIDEGVQVDSCVTDPPYHLKSIVERFGNKNAVPAKHGRDGAFQRQSKGFMGQTWDGGDIANDPEMWNLVFQLLKPGGHLLAFGGTRTYHRMTCGIEDAGFDIRDCIMWLYGSGFPKGHNVQQKMVENILCQLKENAPCVVQCSKSIQVQLNEDKENIVVAFARILPEGDLVLLTETGGVVGLSEVTDMLQSWLMEHMNLNIESLCKELLDENLKEMSKSIIETKSEMIIDQKTWNWLIGQLTFQNITPVQKTLQNGVKWPVITAENILSETYEKLNGTPIVTALGNAIWNPVKTYDGYNVSLKPACEPIVVARKPIAEKSVADNVLTYGTGAINIDGCRVEGGSRPLREISPMRDDVYYSGNSLAGRVDRSLQTSRATGETTQGRYPANVIHDGSEEVLEEFDRYGNRKSGYIKPGTRQGFTETGSNIYGSSKGCFGEVFSSEGSASRFFYCAKASKKDRGEGNNHPTVKPTELMRYLVRMVTPKNGVVLDPFMGSGSTGKAAKLEEKSFIGIDMTEEYYNIAKKRIEETEVPDTLPIEDDE